MIAATPSLRPLSVGELRLSRRYLQRNPAHPLPPFFSVIREDCIPKRLPAMISPAPERRSLRLILTPFPDSASFYCARHGVHRLRSWVHVVGWFRRCGLGWLSRCAVAAAGNNSDFQVSMRRSRDGSAADETYTPPLRARAACTVAVCTSEGLTSPCFWVSSLNDC